MSFRVRSGLRAQKGSLLTRFRPALPASLLPPETQGSEGAGGDPAEDKGIDSARSMNYARERALLDTHTLLVTPLSDLRGSELKFSGAW